MYQKNGKKRFKNPGGAVDISPNAACYFASRNHKAASPTLTEVIKFCNTGQGLYFGKFF